MRITRIGLSLSSAGLLALGAGCHQSETGTLSGRTQTYVPPANTIARVHWLGKDRLGTAASASYFMRLWLLPLSAKLQSQTLFKISTNVCRLFAEETADREAAGDLLRPLLGDVIWNESYLEIRKAANQPAQFAFAIRLNAEHTRLWKTNLASALELLLGAKPVFSPEDRGSWAIKKPGGANQLALSHVGKWTIVTLARDCHTLVEGISNWIHDDKLPAFGAGTNNWLETDLDLKRLAALVPGWHFPTNLPRVSLTINGDGANVLARGKLTFPEPLPLQLQSWTVPTNLVHEPLDSFAAIRGLKPWLEPLKIGQKLPFAAVPTQLFFWSVPGSPYQTFFAAQTSEASNLVHSLTQYLLQTGNPWLARHDYVLFEPLAGTDGARWGNLPSIQPFFKLEDAANHSFVFGGLLQNTRPGPDTQDDLYQRASLAQMITLMSARTNLVYFGWEMTGARVQSCLGIGQFLRVISRHAQLPPDSIGAKWLDALVPRLGPSVTEITVASPTQLSFSRKGPSGLTGAELQLFTDWLESPRFPRGLYSLLVPPKSSPAGNQRP